VFALAVSGSTVYAGGSFVSTANAPSIGGLPRNYIAALDAATGPATAWAPTASLTVQALAVSGATVYAGGEFGAIGGQTRGHIAALDATTGLATAWDPNADFTVFALAVSAPWVYAGGAFGNIGGQPRKRIAGLDATTGAATVWNPGADDAVNAIVVSGTTVYAGGLFTSFGGLPQAGLAAMGDVSTPTQVSLVSAEATAGHVRLTWYAANASDLVATAYRRTLAADWRALGRIAANGTGELVYEDRDVSAGKSYGYRLGISEGGRERFLGETWVDVPLAAAFALGGPRPNPAPKDLTIAFSLPDAARARIEVLDLAGREIVAREVGELGAGNHVLNLASGRTLAPGVYLLRLTRGGRSVTSRAVISR